MTPRAWKGAIVAALVAGALAAPGTGSAASSAAWKGVVVAKESSRHAVVTASAHGVVRTVRVAAVTRYHVGQTLAVKAARLRDGTFRAQHVTVAGQASRAELRAVLIRHQRALSRYLVSAGGSVLVVRTANVRRTASMSRDRPGDEVEMSVSLANGTMTATSVKTVGTASELELEGIFLGLATDGKIRLAVATRGEVQISVPAGTTLPTLTPGDELELVVSVDAAGAFALARLDDAEQATSEDENGEPAVDDEATDEDSAATDDDSAATDDDSQASSTTSNDDNSTDDDAGAGGDD